MLQFIDGRLLNQAVTNFFALEYISHKNSFSVNNQAQKSQINKTFFSYKIKKK